jgi:hypothetical protein
LSERQPAQRVETERGLHEATAPVGQPVAAAVSMPDQPAKRQKKTKKGGGERLFLGIVLALLAVAIGVIIWLAFAPKNTTTGGALAIDENKYQAVFLTSGQIYFGNLTEINDNYLKLSNVFYIQSNNGSDSKNTTDSGDLKLIKLGDEVHKPEDAMIINREQMLFFENIKPDGDVAKLIQRYRQGSQ